MTMMVVRLPQVGDRSACCRSGFCILSRTRCRYQHNAYVTFTSSLCASPETSKDPKTLCHSTKSHTASLTPQTPHRDSANCQEDLVQRLAAVLAKDIWDRDSGQSAKAAAASALYCCTGLEVKGGS